MALVANNVSPKTLYKEVSPFEQASMLTAASRVYSILDTPELEALKQKALDQMMFNSGQTPLTLRADLNNTQRRKAGDLLAQFMMERSSILDMSPLIEGKMRFQDFGIAEEVASLIDQCIANSVPLEGNAGSPRELLLQAALT